MLWKTPPDQLLISDFQKLQGSCLKEIQKTSQVMFDLVTLITGKCSKENLVSHLWPNSDPAQTQVMTEVPGGLDPVKFSSGAQSCPTLCDPMDCSTPGFHHQLPKLTQTHVRPVSDAVQPFDPLLSPSPPAFNLSQHQSFLLSQFFASDGHQMQSNTLHQMGKVLKFQLQHLSFQ